MIRSRKSPIDTTIFLIEGESCRRISLTRGQYAIVDQCEFERVNQFGFNAQWSSLGGYFYAYSTDAAKAFGAKQSNMSMAAVVLNLPCGTRIDHANGSTLDNRKSNLRPATASQNSMNKRVRRDSRSGFIGVSAVGYGRWNAHIRVNGRLLHLGNFASAELAAKARDVASLKYFGEFAKLNFPELIDEYHAILATLAA